MKQKSLSDINICIECEYFVESRVHPGWCNNPELGLSLIDGRPKMTLVTFERSEFQSRCCGIEGKSFKLKQPIIINPKPWWRLW